MCNDTVLFEDDYDELKMHVVNLYVATKNF